MLYFVTLHTPFTAANDWKILFIYPTKYVIPHLSLSLLNGSRVPSCVWRVRYRGQRPSDVRRGVICNPWFLVYFIKGDLFICVVMYEATRSVNPLRTNWSSNIISDWLIPWNAQLFSQLWWGLNMRNHKLAHETIFILHPLWLAQ